MTAVGDARKRTNERTHADTIRYAAQLMTHSLDERWHPVGEMLTALAGASMGGDGGRAFKIALAYLGDK